ncbi:MAG: xanthine dehydrogenase family protein molybdopterin-binding subunit [Nitrospinota bacterium]|jgi:CO/xanthine dehydrogenase Mo-binding subunit|nr:xanthine dehydrogenase family protein molybdopterin-binding subunit [Nitrospinota bacterium]MDP6618921.1 xanthine dehydrogenase family protein molybdopterin-binding subunit [Nitrospinota bacterium]
MASGESRDSWKMAGQAVSRPDAVEKAVGGTLFADDFNLPGCLIGKVVRAGVASARIRKIDVQAARRISGVRAVLTAEDIPGANHTHGEEFPVLADGVVRSAGDAVALVAADHEAAARTAVDALGVELDPRPGVYDPEEALAEDPGAEVGRHTLSRGDADRAFEEADVVVEHTYTTRQADHCFIEPEAGVAWIDSTGVINIRWPTQLIENYRAVARVLGVPAGRVRIRSPMVGGGFGGKEQPLVAAWLALLAQAARRPVRMTLSREDTFLGGSKKHPFVMKYRTAAKRDGTLTAMDVEVLADAGAYRTNTGIITMGAMVLAQGSYNVDNVRVAVRGAVTNRPFSDAMRGIGCNQITLAVEGQVEAVARALGMDPIEIRRKNYLGKGDPLPVGQAIENHVDLDRLTREVEKALGEKTPAPPGKRVGRGFAANMTGYGRPFSRSEGFVGMDVDGSALIRVGVSDLGAGQTSTAAQLVAETLGLSLENVSVIHSDSGTTPLVGYTASSRQTLMSGRALLDAAGTIRRSLVDAASDLLEAPAGDLTLGEDSVRMASAPDKRVSIAEAVSRAQAKGLPIAATGAYKTPDLNYEGADRFGGFAGWTDYTWGVHAAEVMVDEATGEVELLKFVASHDVGAAINPTSVEGQIEGGAVMGIGYALTEEVVMEDGRMANPVLHDYLIPTSLDLGAWETIVTESGEGMGPHGARGIGEPPCNASPGAVTNAVSDAIGARITEIPITPEQVLEILRGNR